MVNTLPVGVAVGYGFIGLELWVERQMELLCFFVVVAFYIFVLIIYRSFFVVILIFFFELER